MHFLLCPRTASSEAKPASRNEKPLITIHIETLLSGPTIGPSRRIVLSRCKAVLVWQDMALHLYDSTLGSHAAQLEMTTLPYGL